MAEWLKHPTHNWGTCRFNSYWMRRISYKKLAWNESTKHNWLIESRIDSLDESLKFRNFDTQIIMIINKPLKAPSLGNCKEDDSLLLRAILKEVPFLLTGIFLKQIVYNVHYTDIRKLLVPQRAYDWDNLIFCSPYLLLGNYELELISWTQSLISHKNTNHYPSGSSQEVHQVGMGQKKLYVILEMISP
ncbi:hypothetical protein M9H77_07120 [Catharanthus roseus]|uniref:Uncharacterized protein n=1 Tax=Catharanthus roseus TaxID=4058 RepID=A0ACC0BU78_CATRO|nr:hypothetical protein M9H77_07120 [Catharanthus roseus]